MTTIARLWNHTARLYREPDAETSRDALGHVAAEPLPVGDAPVRANARPDQTWAGTLQDQGAGEQQGTLRRWFLDRSIPVAERDVLSVTSGPEAPLLLRVMSVTKPAAPLATHHIEVNVVVWDGAVPADLEPEPEP
jgi:hypothetical protein